MRVLADATLPNVNKYFGNQFELDLFNNLSELAVKIKHTDVLVCRSTLKVNSELLANTNLQCVATASSGTDHIDKNYLQQKNIQLFDAKGANASAVCDYVLAVLAFVIKTKQVTINSVGVVGCGEVGSRLIARLEDLGVDVKCYDPLKAKIEDEFESCNFEELYNVDLITVHANLHAGADYPSLNLFTQSVFEKLQPGVILINAARGGIVKEVDLLTTQQDITYCADVFTNEPNINPEIVNYAYVATPHIAGHSIEAKERAVALLAAKISASQQCAIEDGSHSLGLPLNSKQFCDYVLGKYDPTSETIALKKAVDKCSEFKKLRKQHNFRHDF